MRRAREVGTDLARARPGLDHAALHDAVDIDRCNSCGTLHRTYVDVDALDIAYRTQGYTVDRAAALHARMLAALHRDAGWLCRQGVQPGARLLEVGSYVGAFLDFAAERGCDVTGLDPNDQLSRWCRARGHETVTTAFGEYSALAGDFDGVWILNCFEQLPDLDDTLDHARELLRPGGTLVIRTPNAAFASLTCRFGGRRLAREMADANALLGMPFRRCLSVGALALLLTRHGFAVGSVRGHEFSSQTPIGRSASWRWGAPARAALYLTASVISGQNMYPWLDAVATAPLRGVDAG